MGKHTMKRKKLENLTPAQKKKRCNELQRIRRWKDKYGCEPPTAFLTNCKKQKPKPADDSEEEWSEE